MKLLIKLACWMWLVVLIAFSVSAQNVATADLRGRVKDPAGAVITNATLTIRDEAKSFERSTTSDSEGEYQFVLLPPGTYKLTVEAPGFSKLSANNINLTVGQSAQLPVSMKLASAAAEMTISAETEMVETQQTATSTTISQQRIENLPINGRNYINFTLTNSQIARDVAPSIGAAPTSGINFGGQRARANLVNVDGADAVDNSVNGIRSTVSQEAVQEFQIITNGYAAEYGRASGGVVNIVTRGGTNGFHGSAYSYLRNRYIQATNPFSNVSQPAYTRVQPGITFSGPLKKDKTFFFLSWEGTYRQESGFSTIGSNNFGLVSADVSKFFGAPAGAIVIQATPQQAAFFAATPAAAPGVGNYAALVGRASGMALNGLWPAALGGQHAFPTSCTTPPCVIPVPASFTPLTALLGNYPVSEHTNVYSARLDHHFTNNQQLMLRANASPSAVSGIQVNAQNQNFGQNSYSRTSTQNFHDLSIMGQDTWTIDSSKVNEFRYQYARRGLRYDFSRGPGGSNVAVNIGGFAFFGREPFSFVNRVEKRNQFTDNFSWLKGNHYIKFGADVNYIPLSADFTVNFGGVYNFGIVNASDLGLPSSLPGFNAAQAYGLGIPQVFIQGVGNPHDEFTNKTVGAYLQDSWRIRPNLTLNYGVRYDVEFTPTFPAINAGSQAAQDALGITQGIPRDTNNIAPRIGLAWAPYGDNKTVVRASYGMFYDHPLLALAFDSDVADATQAPQLVFFGGAPGGAPCNINATNIFQGLLNCPASFGYLPNEQRFNASLPNSVFVNQNYLTPPGVPLVMQPFGFPTAKNFVYAYTNQVNMTVEHDFGHDLDFSIAYNFSGGHHLNRPINVNPVRADLLTQNFLRAKAAGSTATNPLAVATCGVGPAGAFVPAALVSFFRPSGFNPSLVPVTPPACVALAASVLQADGLGLGVTIPFSDDPTNFSNGSSVYHGLTTNLRKRFSSKFEFLASYTWAHAIDDSTDLQSLLTPQDDYNPSAERANSTFDQRHRFVLSGIYQSGKVEGNAFWRAFASDWTFAPIIEASSGRPFNILTGTDRNFNFSTNTDRPLIVPVGTTTNLCGDPVVASSFSPTGFFQLPCFLNGTFNGNLGRNAGRRPTTIFSDLRVARRIHLGERVNLDGTMDVFNLPNRLNIADVNPLFTNAGKPSAAFDPRQFQFGLKLSF